MPIVNVMQSLYLPILLPYELPVNDSQNRRIEQGWTFDRSKPISSTNRLKPGFNRSKPVKTDQNLMFDKANRSGYIIKYMKAKPVLG